MIKAIIFDFDSTLVDYHYGDEQAILRITERLPEIDKKSFYEKSGEILWQFYKDGLDHGSDVHKMRLQKTIEAFGLTWEDDYLQEYFNIYLNIVKPYEGAIELLQYLKGKVKLGLLTNSTDAKEQRIRIKNSNMESYFDQIVIAREIGYYKPQKEAFFKAMEKLGVQKNETIYIGDSEQFDIEGAKNAGMLAIKRTNNNNIKTIADQSFTSFHVLKWLLTMKYKL